MSICQSEYIVVDTVITLIISGHPGKGCCPAAVPAKTSMTSCGFWRVRDRTERVRPGHDLGGHNWSEREHHFFSSITKVIQK